MTAKNVTELNLQTIEKLAEGAPIIFCGSTTMDQKTFDSNLKVPLDATISKKAQIRVGCAEGCDLFVQKHCAEKGYFNVHVYVPVEKKDDANIESEQFHIEMVAGKFKDRDRAMQKDCNSIVAVLSQYAGQASGTAANIISIAAKNGVFGAGDCLHLDGYAIVELLRKYSLPFNITTQTYVVAQEAA